MLGAHVVGERARLLLPVNTSYSYCMRWKPKYMKCCLSCSDLGHASLQFVVTFSSHSGWRSRKSFLWRYANRKHQQDSIPVRCQPPACQHTWFIMTKFEHFRCGGEGSCMLRSPCGQTEWQTDLDWKHYWKKTCWLRSGLVLSIDSLVFFFQFTHYVLLSLNLNKHYGSLCTP